MNGNCVDIYFSEVCLATKPHKTLLKLGHREHTMNRGLRQRCETLGEMARNVATKGVFQTFLHPLLVDLPHTRPLPFFLPIAMFQRLTTHGAQTGHMLAVPIKAFCRLYSIR